ncbi:GNAT family N-acetyltransferase [Deinococcus wulumuqiensis]|uniref:Phosphinothricin acetyltransferase n=1 Tax=Deinococcus wulumuqiensis TaxID=980427 RepID=A0AAV4K9J9_9DEIO|nr:GNAT family N-acetyltransferase [Deinococcus wulumuqiensis]GGI89867.1 phosphinothricin acetyltransferase [Deinococcus wulumuqiensis]GGP30660.1 phosphinothricin acetyltransferase [Deinococcus wulumuqiensis]
MTTIRPATPADLAAALDIYNAVYPDHAKTLEETEHFLAGLRDNPLQPHVQDWLAEVGGRPVGTARLWQAPWMFHPDRYHLELAVLPEFRRRGIGAALFGTAQRHWQGRGAREVLAGAKETEADALPMLERQGFREVMRFFDNVLRLDGFDAAQWEAEMRLPEGVRAATFADLQTELGEEAAWLAYYACQTEARLDVPRTAPATHTPFEEFVKHRSQPRLVPENIWLAVTEGSEVVALSELWRDSSDPARLNIGLTGTRRAWRRRGLGLALKLRGMVQAQQHGIREIWTSNASNNAPMLALNDRLGFRRQPAHVECQWGGAEDRRA